MRTIRIAVCAILAMGLHGQVLFAQPQHFQFTSNTGNNATVGIPLTANPNISGSPLAPGDEIGAFSSDGLCVGALVWDGSVNASLTVWGDNDQTPEVDGMVVGDTIRYRVWRQSTNTEYGSVTTSYLTGDGVYRINSLHTLSSLTAIAPPEAPALVTPPNGVTNQPTALTLTWATAVRADVYRLQVATDSLFASLVLNQSTSDTSSQLASLLNNTTYYWRVNASNPGGTSNWSITRHFTTTLAAPILTSPPDGVTDQPTTLVLGWNGVSGATRYGIQLSTNSAFTSFVVDDTTTGTSYEMSSLATSTTYFWRVNATNAGGTGEWSAVQSFTTVPPPPSAPAPISPADNATLQPTTLTFSWSAVTGAAGYRLQVSAVPSFGSTVFDDSTIAQTSREVGSLTHATTYYWRVHARNSGGSSAWSAVRNFTTIGVPMTHGVSLSAGWNMISSFVRPTTRNLDTLTVDIRNTMVIIKNGQGQVYWPAIPANTIGSWNDAHGYQVYMTRPDTLFISGNEIIPGMNSLPLAQGWHLLSYLRNGSLRVDSALSTIASNLVIVKNNNGEVYWPELGVNDIGSMDPGQGYQLYLSAAATLTYPANEQSSPGDVVTVRSGVASNRSSRSASPVHYFFKARTGNNATIGIPASAQPTIDGMPLTPGDEIGVFTPAGLCVGAAVWNESGVAVSVWGDDPQTPEIDGIRSGERFLFSIWRASENSEAVNTPAAYSQGDGFYTPDGLFVLSSLGSEVVTNVGDRGGIPTEYGLGQNYPNPFNPTTTIRFDLPRESRVSLRVFDLLGRQITVLIDQNLRAGFHSVEFSGKGLPSGVYLYRVETDGFIRIRKMILMR